MVDHTSEELIYNIEADHKELQFMHKVFAEILGGIIEQAQAIGAKAALPASAVFGSGAMDRSQQALNELVRRAKAIHPLLPTLIVSGTVSSLDHAQAADYFLPKGQSSPVGLIERVRILTARKRGPRK